MTTPPFWVYFDEDDDRLPQWLVMNTDKGDIARAWGKATAERIADALNNAARAEAAIALADWMLGDERGEGPLAVDDYRWWCCDICGKHIPWEGGQRPESDDWHRDGCALAAYRSASEPAPAEGTL